MAGYLNHKRQIKTLDEELERVDSEFLRAEILEERKDLLQQYEEDLAASKAANKLYDAMAMCVVLTCLYVPGFLMAMAIRILRYGLVPGGVVAAVLITGFVSSVVATYQLSSLNVFSALLID